MKHFQNPLNLSHKSFWKDWKEKQNLEVIRQTNRFTVKWTNQICECRKLATCLCLVAIRYAPLCSTECFTKLETRLSTEKRLERLCFFLFIWKFHPVLIKLPLLHHSCLSFQQQPLFTTCSLLLLPGFPLCFFRVAWSSHLSPSHKIYRYVGLKLDKFIFQGQW